MATFNNVREARLAAKAAQNAPVAQTTQTQAPVQNQTVQTSTAPVISTPVAKAAPAPRLLAMPGQQLKEVIGNISQNPVTRATDKGSVILNFSVAVRKLDAQGFEMRHENPAIDRAECVDFYQIDIWENNGQNSILQEVAEHLEKGQEVLVKGRYSTRSVPSRNNPGQMMMFKTINATQVLLLKRVMVDGEMKYQGYDLSNEATIDAIEEDLDSRFTRRQNRAFQPQRQQPSQQQVQQAQEMAAPVAPRGDIWEEENATF